ncbi:MAG: aminopeptidase P family protein [Dehalococcoidales bacterium]|nr:aminopeptidase P family protein [Dehalococcoidales bacterium]
MSISKAEFDRRYGAIRDWMKSNSVDCIVVSGKPDNFNRGNIRYLTGLGNGGYCLFPPEGRPVLLVGRKAEFLSRPDLPVELSEHPNPQIGIIKGLNRYDQGHRIGTIGMETSDPVLLDLKASLGNRLIDATPIFSQLRLIKSPEEIEKMRTAAWIADKVFYMVQDLIRPGLSDFVIYGEVKRLIYSLGCEYSMELIDANGARMNMKFTPVGDTLSADGTLFMEITPAYDGYYAQLPVIFPVVYPAPNLRKIAAVWKQALQAGIDMLKPGTRVSDLCNVMWNKVKEGGYLSPFRPGHALGLDAIDFWSITDSNETVLQPGMTLAVHPCVLQEMGGDGIGMGYTFLITETGAERFSRVDLFKLFER